AFVQRTGSANPLGGFSVAHYDSRPAFADLDGDGDLELVAGDNTGVFSGFENTGDAKHPAFVALTGAANPMNGVDVGEGATPTLGDLDGDGSPDLVAGNLQGTFNTFVSLHGWMIRRTGAMNPLDGQDVGNIARPAAVDFDGDGDLDL